MRCLLADCLIIYSKIFSFQYQGPLKESNDFKLISDQDLGIRGSCPGYQERQDITEEIRSQTDYQSLETVFKRYCVISCSISFFVLFLTTEVNLRGIRAKLSVFS